MMQVFYASIDILQDESLRAQCMKLLHPLRQEKIRARKQETDQLESMLAGLLFRKGCLEAGIDYETLSLEIGAWGKPVLAENKDFYFNLSHSSGYAAAVFANHPVGIDLEGTARLEGERGKKRIERVLRRILSKEESEWMQSLPKEKQLEAFVQLWTRKESYAKADGRGMGIEFSSFSTLENESYLSQWLDKNVYMSVYGRQNAEYVKICRVVSKTEWM